MGTPWPRGGGGMGADAAWGHHDQTDKYMWSIKVKLDAPYIRRCPAQTDEYNFIFIGFGTDEYNLNIFISTDE
jgi:hypothetical protein